MLNIIIVLTALMTLASSDPAHAGRIFGNIETDGKPIAEGVKITITAPVPEGAAHPAPKPILADSTVTGPFGAYLLKVKGEGKCTLTVRWEKQTPSIQIFSYNTATRYDLILEKKEDKFVLKRK